MVVFEKLIRKIERVKRSVPFLVEETAKDRRIEDLMVELNQEQMYDGKNADNSDIQPDYSQVTVKYKKKKGDPYDRVTLFDEGSFYGAMKNVYSASGITLTSTDAKTKDLKKKYGDKIFGLNGDNLKEVRREFFDILQPKILQKLWD